MTIAITARVQLPRHGFGCDWEAKRRLLATNGKRTELFIVAGHSSANGAWGFGRSYHPAALVLAQPAPWNRSDVSHTWLAEGRITKAVLDQHAAEIDKAFGEPVSVWLSTRLTVEVRP